MQRPAGRSRASGAPYRAAVVAEGEPPNLSGNCVTIPSASALGAFALSRLAAEYDARS